MAFYNLFHRNDTCRNITLLLCLFNFVHVWWMGVWKKPIELNWVRTLSKDGPLPYPWILNGVLNLWFPSLLVPLSSNFRTGIPNLRSSYFRSFGIPLLILRSKNFTGLRVHFDGYGIDGNFLELQMVYICLRIQERQYRPCEHHRHFHHILDDEGYRVMVCCFHNLLPTFLRKLDRHHKRWNWEWLKERSFFLSFLWLVHAFGKFIVLNN